VPDYIFLGKHIMPELEFFFFFFCLPRLWDHPEKRGFAKFKHEIWENGDFFVPQWRKKQ
jgi:hypothetical protein